MIILIDVKDLYSDLITLFENKIVILDGAMGTMVQQYKLEEEDFRGEFFKDHHINLKNNNDLLCITKPDVVREIHYKYLASGADIIETNTFNGTSVSMADFDLCEYVYQINFLAARLAREQSDKVI